MATNLQKLKELIRVVDTEKEVEKDPKERKLQRVEHIMQLVTDSMTREDFLEAFDTLTKVMLNVGENMQKRSKDHLAILESNFEQLKTTNNANFDEKTKEVMTKIASALKDQESGMNFIYDKIASLRHGKDGEDGKDGKDGIDGRDGKDAEVDTKEIIKSVIEEIDDKFKDIDKKISNIPRGGMSSRYVHVPMVDDFSGDTDGATKSFTLSKAPKSTTTMKVWGSDFPIILRSGTDFTVTGKTLTLTDEVDAPSTGATLITEYYV